MEKRIAQTEVGVNSAIPAHPKDQLVQVARFRGVRRFQRLGQRHSASSEASAVLTSAIPEHQRSRTAWPAPFCSVIDLGRSGESHSGPSEASGGLARAMPAYQKLLPS